MRVIQQLARGEARVSDLVGELGLAQSTGSAHLACLPDCNLVTSRAAGRQVFYALAHLKLLDFLRTAEDLLAISGEQVTLCPNYGIQAAQSRRATA